MSENKTYSWQAENSTWIETCDGCEKEIHSTLIYRLRLMQGTKLKIDVKVCKDCLVADIKQLIAGGTYDV